MMTARRVVSLAAIPAAGAGLLLAAPARDEAVSATGDRHPLGTRVGCDTQSGAGFPGAYANRRNRVVGPLAMIGGATPTGPANVAKHGGNKFPLLVRAGHTVTVSVPASHRATAGLNYGFQPLRAHTITFTACSAGRSESRADGPVTFWSGFVLTTTPSCVPLDVWVDYRRPRRRVGVALGRGCAGAGIRAPQPPLRGCATRAESGSPEDGRPRPDEVTVGPLRFAGLARLADRRQLGFEPDPGVRNSGVDGVKVGLLVPAGARATLSIGAGARGWAALQYAPRQPGIGPHPAGEPAVRLQACAADEPAFSHDGTVGPVTGFSGGFVLARPGCVPLEVRVPGRPVVRVRVSFGVGRCR